MECANCRQEGRPAYTLLAHVGEDRGTDARTDGGEDVTVDLQFCSVECLRSWT